MQTLRATLTLGFEGGPQFKRASPAQRRRAEDKVARSIRSISLQLRIAWGAIPIDANDNGGLTETAVRTALRAALARSADHGSRFVLSLIEDSQARLHRIQRWSGGAMLREHAYFIERIRKPVKPNAKAIPWTVNFEGERLRIVACFSWETPI